MAPAVNYYLTYELFTSASLVSFGGGTHPDSIYYSGIINGGTGLTITTQKPTGNPNYVGLTVTFWANSARTLEYDMAGANVFSKSGTTIQLLDFNGNDFTAPYIQKLNLNNDTSLLLMDGNNIQYGFLPPLAPYKFVITSVSSSGTTQVNNLIVNPPSGWNPSNTTFTISAFGNNQTNITSSTTTLNSAVIPVKTVKVPSNSSSGNATLRIEIRDSSSNLTTDDIDSFMNDSGNTTTRQVLPTSVSLGVYEFSVPIPTPTNSETFYLGTGVGGYIFMAFAISNGVGAPCFFGNAPVLTAFGYQRIDKLRSGDLIVTSGGIVPIREVKMYNVDASVVTNPYLIPKGMYKAMEDVLISPEHCVKVGNEMIPAKNLGLVQQNMTGVLKYYNIELSNWYNMFVAGIEVETLAPVKWVTVSLAEFNKAVRAQCGEMSPELENTIKSRVKFLDNGMVECPIFRRA